MSMKMKNQIDEYIQAIIARNYIISLHMMRLVDHRLIVEAMAHNYNVFSQTGENK